ncbi:MULTISPECIES: hypothetical protein [unclassified Crossiella]|uniref:hypothetical protein n=1 Tax=unclassified Crossiella TaxID=2620835 RepID=UPI001FFEC35B|nr:MULTISPECIES: hypothetical protein [unclassified Crossiella]MCK2238940.1 hypothetical protein [Crossiella sp. S99.2]MCK2251490.1 hypothetical protein [Crossiella sp. S99.1]
MIAVLAGVLVAVAGCGAGEGEGTTSPSTSATVAGMSAPEYQAVLTGVEQAARPLIERISGAGSVEDLAAAREELAKLLDVKRGEIDKIVPPAAAKQAHTRFAAFVAVAPQLRVTPKPEVEANECGIAPGPEVHLAQVKRYVRTALHTALTGVAEELDKQNLKLGNLIPAEVEEPAEQNRQAKNGEVVHRSGPKGRARLDISNDGDSDVAVSAVVGKPDNPRATIYVRAKSKATLSSLAGTYEVYFKSGADWDGKRRGFTRDCAFQKFDQSFSGNAHWQITLTPVVGGNASTTKIPAF